MSLDMLGSAVVSSGEPSSYILNNTQYSSSQGWPRCCRARCRSAWAPPTPASIQPWAPCTSPPQVNISTVVSSVVMKFDQIHTEHVECWICTYSNCNQFQKMNEYQYQIGHYWVLTIQIDHICDITHDDNSWLYWCLGMMSPHHLAHHPHHHPHGPPMPLSDVDTDPRELGTGLLYWQHRKQHPFIILRTYGQYNSI